MKSKVLSLIALVTPLFCTGAQAQESYETFKSHHVFVRDTSVPALNEAWRDESGMIWGDIVRNDDDHSIRYMNQYDASEYCLDIGAQLPSREDFQRLLSYFGGATDFNNSYKPQALPNLYFITASHHPQSLYFWSSSALRSDASSVSVFNGLSGGFGNSYRVDSDSCATRCVVRR